MARSKLYDLYSPKGERIFKNAKADILASYIDVDRRKVVIYARSEKPGRATGNRNGMKRDWRQEKEWDGRGEFMAIISAAVCDRCRRSIAYGHVSKKYVREWARAQGWSFGKQDLCPECNKKRTKNKAGN